MRTNSGDQAAFPMPINSSGDSGYMGITKHEYFAAMAMQSLIVADRNNDMSDFDIAGHASKLANALINELDKPS